MRGWYPIELLHFPIRSFEQCDRKYANLRGSLGQSRNSYYEQCTARAGRALRRVLRVAGGRRRRARARPEGEVARARHAPPRRVADLREAGGALSFARPTVSTTRPTPSTSPRSARPTSSGSSGDSTCSSLASSRSNAAGRGDAKNRRRCDGVCGGAGREARPHRARARRGGRDRRPDRLPPECRGRFRGRDRQRLPGRDDRDPRVVRAQRLPPPDPRAGGGAAPGRVGDADGAARRDRARRGLGDQQRRGRVLVAARRFAEGGAGRRPEAVRDRRGVLALVRAAAGRRLVLRGTDDAASLPAGADQRSRRASIGPW